MEKLQTRVTADMRRAGLAALRRGSRRASQLDRDNDIVVAVYKAMRGQELEAERQRFQRMTLAERLTVATLAVAEERDRLREIHEEAEELESCCDRALEDMQCACETLSERV